MKTDDDATNALVAEVLKTAVLPPICELLVRLLSLVERLTDRIEVLELEALHRRQSAE